MKTKSLKMFVAAFISLFAFTATMPVFAQTTGGGTAAHVKPNSCGVRVVNSPDGLGVTVTRVNVGEPCDLAGIEEGDFILGIEKNKGEFEAIFTRRHLENALGNVNGTVEFIIQDVDSGDLRVIPVALP